MRELTDAERQILDSHKKWSRGDADGKQADLRGVDLSCADLRCADLSGVDLSCADLRDADLRCADLSGATLRDADLRCADLRDADLRCADLSSATLRDANLRCADLRGANLDYACWPLWCGSLDAIIDKRIFAQLAYHLCRTVCDDPEVREAQRSLRHIANQFHRVDECGMIGDDVDD